jgi:glycopeptide antibiotics resistance protein
MPRRRIVLALATAVWLAVIGVITLTPSPTPPNDVGFIRGLIAWIGSTPLTAWFTYDVAEFTANVLMFVPLGALLAAQFGWRRWWLAGVLALLLSCCIEAAQALWLPSRFADVRDLISNGSGGFIGAALVLLGARMRATNRTETADAR